MRGRRPEPIEARGRLSGGRFHLPAQAAGELTSRSPANPDDVIGAFPYAPDDVPEAVVAAVRAAREWGGRPLIDRLGGLLQLRPHLIRRGPDLVATLCRETGRPQWECQREVQGLLHRLEQTVQTAPQQLDDRTYGELPARVLSRPLGVVAVIGPAMLPLATSHTHLLAALAAGNSVVWKPSPLCPASAQLYAEILYEADLPPGVINVIYGDDDTGRALAAHPQVDGVVFTGTAAHGHELRTRLAGRYDLRLLLHLSAKNAAVVLEDADVPLAAYEIVVSAFLSAGQRCTALSRALVHRAVLDEFLTAATAIAQSLRIGPPEEPAFMGPMLDQARMERFLKLREAAREQGAEPVLPAEPVERPGWFVAPSIHLIAERRRDAPYQQEELFGPDLAVYPVRDIDDALPLCDETEYGLCAALFSRTPMRWKRFAEEIRAGALFWNRGTHAPSGLMPFGGEKRSGLGGRGGADAILQLRREVSLLGRTHETVEALPGTLLPKALEAAELESE
jgi:succinylglutamic semialdehyde dehydrogenase